MATERMTERMTARPTGLTVTGTLQHQAWANRTTPPVEQVRPRVWSVPIDYAENPIRYTFCYLLLGANGDAVIVDPGFDSALGRYQLAEGLKAAADARRVVGVVSTHFHIDHMGMVAHAAKSGGWIAMSEREHAELAVFDHPTTAIAQDRAWLAELGAPKSLLIDAPMLTVAAGFARPTALVRQGNLLPLKGRSIQVVATPGHTPGHICLVDEDEAVVLSGDHVLPRISPNVGLTTTGRRPRALEQYLASLDRIAAWDGMEVLPAHEYRFDGLAERARQLAEHHAERLDEVLELVRESGPSDVWTLAAQVAWSRPWESLKGMQLRAALGETSAHVDRMIDTGALTVKRHRPWTISVARAQGPKSQ